MIRFSYSLEESQQKLKEVSESSLIYPEQIKDYFNSFGELKECRMMKDKSTSKSKPF